MDSEIQKAVDSGKLTSNEASNLEKLKPGAWCIHKSWGFGQVTDWNLLLNQIVINFTGKKGHIMQPKYAASTLQPLSETHILVRVATDKEGVRKQAADDPLALVKNVLESYNGRIRPDQLADILISNGVFNDKEYKRWWDSTKKALKKDGMFEITAKRTDPIVLRSEAISRSDELLHAYNSETLLKNRLIAAAEILKGTDDFENPFDQLQPIINDLEKTAEKNQNLDKPQALECLVIRDELKAVFPELITHPNITTASFLKSLGDSLGQVLEIIPSARMRPLLKVFPEAFGEKEWPEAALQLLPEATSRTINDVTRFLRDQDQLEILTSRLSHWIRERSITTEVLCWFCKERNNGFAELVNRDLLAAIINSLERDQFSEKRTMRLHDLLIEDRDLIPQILEGEDKEAVREIMRRLILSTVFEELTKRSLLARIIKLHPEMQNLLTANEAQEQEQQGSLIVSWESLETRKQEYEELVNTKIPENTKEIALARSYGDLRENFEFKAAKQNQAVLMRRKSELERDLERARGIDYAAADTSVVSIGTTVHLKKVETGEKEVYTILGAWDSDPDNHILSYLTVIGQILLGKKAGEIVSLPTESETYDVEILEITRYKKS